MLHPLLVIQPNVRSFKLHVFPPWGPAGPPRKSELKRSRPFGFVGRQFEVDRPRHVSSSKGSFRADKLPTFERAEVTDHEY